MNTIKAVRFSLGVLLGIALAAGPASAQAGTPIDQMVEKAKSGAMTQAELAAGVLLQAEVDQSIIASPDKLLFQFPGFADVIGPAAVERVELALRKENTVASEQLQQFVLRLLGDKSKYTAQVFRWCDLNFKFKQIYSRGTAQEIKSFRNALTTPAEREVFLPQLEKFIGTSLVRRVRQDPAPIALNNLAEFAEVGSPDVILRTAQEILTDLQAQQHNGQLDFKTFMPETPGTADFLAGLSRQQPALKTSIFPLFTGRVLTLVRAEKWDDAQGVIDMFAIKWPEDSAALVQLEKDAVRAVNTESGKPFAVHIVGKLDKRGQLGAGDKIKFMSAGYYASTASKVVLVVLILLLVTLIGLLFVGRFAPGTLGIVGLSENKLEAMKKERMRKKAKKRGAGYMIPIEEDDEYSKLLAKFGLNDSATDADIKRAYRKMVKEYHPDAHGAAGVVKNDSGGVDRTFEELKKTYEKLLTMRGSSFGTGR